MNPIFKLYLEKSKDEKFNILFAKKRPFNKTTNFIITLDNKIKNSRENDACLGKLRGDKSGDNYQLFNNGENPKMIGKV
jgi:hypothetical protein